MKQILLTAAAIATMSVSASAQTRMTLHEEFTGENCGPCAVTNPGFWSLCDGSGNPSKLIHISYMVPIPSAGYYCNRTAPIYQRMDRYYSVPFAPYGRYDGHVPDPTATNPGHPGSFTQADIDAEAAVAAPFNISITSAWNSTYDSVTSSITVTCVSAYSGTLYLRTALVKTDDFASSPGSNGETHFENVVQALYPDTLGTSMAGTWTIGMTNTYTITGAVPNWVDKSESPYIVTWIQNDVDKSIQQAAQSAILPGVPNDAAITSVSGGGSLICNANGPYTLAHTVTLKNTGTSTLTSATIYYKIDGGSILSYPWTGSIAPGATTTVAMPSASITIAGALYHTAVDSVASPNGTADVNTVNNNGGTSLFIESTSALALPYSTSFESTDQGKFDFVDPNNNSEAWAIYNNGTGTPLGHTGSNAAMFNCYGFAAGETDIMTLPEVATGGPATLQFYTAHGPYSATTTENDMLEVVYSTDCGGNWTSIWSKSGTTLSNLPANGNPIVPTASQYVAQSASLNSVPAGAIVGFRGTSDYGNDIWVDDINIHSSVGVNELYAATANVKLFPNPAKDEATLSFSLTGNSDVTIQIVDGLGRVVNMVANEKMTEGSHAVNINTSSLAGGIYNVMIHTDGGTTTERLTVVK